MNQVHQEFGTVALTAYLSGWWESWETMKVMCLLWRNHLQQHHLHMGKAPVLALVSV